MSPRTGLLGVLVPDETARRAFEETLADWREEWTRASTPIERMRVSTRGWISVARLVAGTMRVGLLTSETWAVLSMAVLVSASLSLLMIPSVWWYTPGPLALPDFVVAVLFMLPQGMVVLLAPVASIGFGTKPWREPSVYFIFGIAIRRRLSTAARWGIARFVAGASAACAFTVSDYAVFVLRDVSPAIADLPGRGGLSIWLSSMVLCLAIGVLCRIPNQTSEP